MSPSLYNARIIPIEDVPMDDCIVATTQPHVLVVDDEPLVADTLSAILQRAGFNACAAYSGQSALLMAERILPELLITDVSMPVMDGIELAMTLVSNKPGCKVLLFSGHATSADLVAAVAAGYNFPLLAKPMHPTELLRHVSQMLEVPDMRFVGKRVDSFPGRASSEFALRSA